MLRCAQVDWRVRDIACHRLAPEPHTAWRASNPFDNTSLHTVPHTPQLLSAGLRGITRPKDEKNTKHGNRLGTATLAKEEALLTF